MENKWEKYKMYLKVTARVLNREFEESYSERQWEILLYRDLSAFIIKYNEKLTLGELIKIRDRKIKRPSNIKNYFGNLSRVLSIVYNVLVIQFLKIFNIKYVYDFNSESLREKLKYKRIKFLDLATRNTVIDVKLRKRIVESVKREGSFPSEEIEALIDYLNSGYIENFHFYNKLITKVPILPHKITYLSNSYASVFKRFLLIHNIHHVNIHTIQHGANYFENVEAHWERPEISISNKFYSWFDTGVKNATPLLPYKPLDMRKKISRETIKPNTILMVLNANAVYQNEAYYDALVDYMNNLYKNERIHVWFRKSSLFWASVQNYFYDRLREPKTRDESSNIYTAMGRSEIIFIDRPFSTAYWEAKLAGKRVLFFSSQTEYSKFTDWYKVATKNDVVVLEN